MKLPHLLRVTQPPDRFSPLVEAARALGLRIGWLELGAPAAPIPPSLEAAAGLGVLRAVAVGEGRTIAVKPLRGPTVLKDLMREHFRGCALVLVQGEIQGEAEVPALEPEDDAWSLTLPEGASRRLTTAQLAESLRKPRPWEPLPLS
jgi:hypothetical protein